MKLIVRKSMDTKQANLQHQKEILKSHVRSLPKKKHEELRLEAIEAIKNQETTLEQVESLIGRIKQALYG
jgi:hypothetical protein